MVARMRRLSMRVRWLPVRRLRLRLARLRRLWLRRLWLLLVMGTLPHLLKGTLPFESPVRQKPQPALRGWPGLTVLACPPNGGS